MQENLPILLRKGTLPLIKELLAKDEDAGDMKKTGTTVGRNFKNQLTDLMSTLASTCPHYVRCIKPNALKQPGVFDDDMVLLLLLASSSFV
jgi:myosin-5